METKQENKQPEIVAPETVLICQTPSATNPFSDYQPRCPDCN